MNKQELIVSGPSRARQVSIRSKITSKVMEESRFPPPLEVDRELYRKRPECINLCKSVFVPSRGRQGAILKVQNHKTQAGPFRPLSRQIGSYTQATTKPQSRNFKFPAPLEVDRYLYQSSTLNLQFLLFVSIPSRGRQGAILSKRSQNETIHSNLVSVPSRGRQGAIPSAGWAVNTEYEHQFPAPLEVDRELYPISCI